MDGRAAAGPAGADRRPDLRRRAVRGHAAVARRAGQARPLPAGPGGRLRRVRQLYHESWSQPPVRWLLSTVPSVMIFDDHEIIDDWNSSAAWLAEMRRAPVVGRAHARPALASYWLFQHLGNMTPDELAADPVGRAPARRHAARSRTVADPTTRGATARRRPHPADHARLPRQPGARRAASGACCRRRTGTELAEQARRRLRPPGARLLAALAAGAGDPPRRGRDGGAVATATAARWRSCAASTTWSTGPRSATRSTS